MVTCRWCDQPFQEAKPWQEFCCQRHQQDWHLHQRKLARVEEAEDRRAERMNGQGTPEQRQKASEVFARFGGGQRPMVRRI
jgi:hypothetical protein